MDDTLKTEPSVEDARQNELQATLAVQASPVAGGPEIAKDDCCTRSDRPLVTADMALRHLQLADLSPRGDVRSAALRLGCFYRLSPEDLLSHAFFRLMDQKHLPLHVPAAALLIKVMQSIGNAELRTRAKRDDIVARHLDELARATMAQGEHMLDPEQMLLRREDDSATCRLLDRIADGDEELAALIDLRLDGLFGNELAIALGLRTAELATVQRRLKRRARAQDDDAFWFLPYRQTAIRAAMSESHPSIV